MGLKNLQWSFSSPPPRAYANKYQIRFTLPLFVMMFVKVFFVTFFFSYWKIFVFNDRTDCKEFNAVLDFLEFLLRFYETFWKLSFLSLKPWFWLKKRAILVINLDTSSAKMPHPSYCFREDNNAIIRRNSCLLLIQSYYSR